MGGLEPVSCNMWPRYSDEIPLLHESNQSQGMGLQQEIGRQKKLLCFHGLQVSPNSSSDSFSQLFPCRITDWFTVSFPWAECSHTSISRLYVLVVFTGRRHFLTMLLAADRSREVSLWSRWEVAMEEPQGTQTMITVQQLSGFPGHSVAPRVVVGDGPVKESIWIQDWPENITATSHYSNMKFVRLK